MVRTVDHLREGEGAIPEEKDTLDYKETAVDVRDGR